MTASWALFTDGSDGEDLDSHIVPSITALGGRGGHRAGKEQVLCAVGQGTRCG